MLNLVRMELRGFKSFADKVVIPFNEGVTAIIGPNGCGKSNVADAIRWTLGERRAKQLRGKQMQDVIFAGTEKRKSLSYCEVTLVFNNAGEHIFPGFALEEVSVTRKMDRSGRSEYFINNNKCNLKNIERLFADTGAGKEGYSIIGQGKVAEIMSAKPEDRRHIFEEAAEISTSRNNKAESERKLEKALLNMQTTNEVIAEIEKQINPLKKQAEIAEKYMALKEQLKALEVNLYIYNYENNREIKQKIYDRIDRTKLQLKQVEDSYRECVERYDECTSTSTGIDRLYEEQNAELMALKIAATRVEGDAALVKERISNVQHDIARINAEITSLDDQLIVTDKLIASSEQKRDEKFAEFMKLSESSSSLEAKYKALAASVAGQEEDIDARNREYLQTIEELGELKANYSSYIAERGIESERAKNLNEALIEKKARLDEEKTNLAIYDGKLSSSKERMRALIEEYNETLSDKNDAAEAKKAYEEDIIKLNSGLGLAQGNLELQRSVKEQYSGYQEAVQRLMQDSKHDPVLASKIWGVLAEVIKVPSEFVTAIDYALGGAMQNVLCESEHDASDLINYLKRKNYGRVTFRPYTACRPRGLEGASLGVLKEPGCLGLASELISYDKKFEPFIGALLGATVIVNNLDNAKLLFRKYNQAFRIVTLSGEIFTRAGEITGGSKRNQSQSLLSQEQNISSAEMTVEKYKNNISTMRARLADKEQEIKDGEEKLAALNAEMSELRIEIGLNESKAKQAFDSTQTLSKEISEAAEEYEKVRATIADIDAKINSIDKLEKIAAEKKDEWGALIEASRSQGTKQRSEREELQSEVMQTRIKLASLNSEIDLAKADISRYQRQRGELEEEKIDNISLLKSRQAELENIAHKAQNVAVSEQDAARIRELEEGIAALSERKRTITEEIKQCDEQKTSLFESKNDLNAKIVRDEAMLDNVDMDIRNQQQHILEEYDLTYSTAIDLRAEDFDAKGATGEIAELKRSIARLGDVNPLALSSLKEAQERLEEQLSLRDDLQRAIDDIKRIIGDITDDMRDRFKTAFDKINENFKVIFQQLFGGGKGELRLSSDESDDVLEQGIEIFAQPPGKKLQNIGLLSGGEQALTAISILFAILKLKPMPFCVLDEIEAALDDANVNLFGEFLKKFSDFTQFIVITHRKPTMRHADTIFGVTMEEKGVTKIVSIEFEEAEKHAELR